MLSAFATVIALLGTADAKPVAPLQHAVRQASPANSTKYANWPSFDSLPLNKSAPYKAAWGAWVGSYA